MRNEDHINGCSPGSCCGACPDPCFPTDTGSFEALIGSGPADYDGLSDDEPYPITIELDCARWNDSRAACDPKSCASNYFCFDSLFDPRALTDEDGDSDS